MSKNTDPRSPAERTAHARYAAHLRWAREPDRRAAMAPAWAGFVAKFLREVDPDGRLPEEERQRRARSLMAAHNARAARNRSKKARQKRERPQGDER